MEIKPNEFQDKCKDILRCLTDQTEEFPQSHDGDTYWHLHLPVDSDFMASVVSQPEIRQCCVQALICRAQHLASLAPQENLNLRVVVAVSWPDFWQSQIIVFFDSKYFDKFFSRNTASQCWTLLGKERSLAREWSITIPIQFSELGYRQEMNDTDDNSEGEVWFIGQL